MNNIPLTPPELDNILAGVHEELEDGASGARIREIADAHPEARDEILAFAAEWFASDGSDLSDDNPGHFQMRVARKKQRPPPRLANDE